MLGVILKGSNAKLKKRGVDWVKNLKWGLLTATIPQRPLGTTSRSFLDTGNRMKYPLRQSLAEAGHFLCAKTEPGSGDQRQHRKWVRWGILKFFFNSLPLFEKQKKKFQPDKHFKVDHFDWSIYCRRPYNIMDTLELIYLLYGKSMFL